MVRRQNESLLSRNLTSSPQRLLLQKRGLKKKNNKRTKRLTIAFSIMLVLIVSKMLSVSWGCKGHGSVEGEKKEILQRRDYLVETLVVSPSQVLDEMPSGIDEQFQGEWALYSCSMLSAALSNISSLKQSTHRLLYTQNTNIACAKVHQRFDK